MARKHPYTESIEVKEKEEISLDICGTKEEQSSTEIYKQKHKEKKLLKQLLLSGPKMVKK